MSFCSSSSKHNFAGPNTFNENETIAKYEIMDGAPVRGESIPIRVFLAGYDLTPTMRDINKKFSVRYHLNLVLVDEEERRYFKQQVWHIPLCVTLFENIDLVITEFFSECKFLSLKVA